MRIEQLIAGLKRISYKPNFHIDIQQIERCIVRVRFRVEVPDSDNPKRIIPVWQENTFNCLEYNSIDHVLHIVESWIYDFEMHEVYEWFRIDGKRVRNPHGKKENS